MNLIDSHSHLNFPQFKDDLNEVIKRSHETGLTRMINVGTDLTTSRESVELAEKFPDIYATVGIHPHDAASLASDFEELSKLAANPRVVAIGEIGLDYFRNLAPHDVQAEAFIRQLDLALSLGRPVVLHCRDAYVEMLEILNTSYLGKLNGRAPGILHSFATGPATAHQFVSAGFLLGINNLSTYPQNESIRETIRVIPLTSLVLETDCPFLPPQALRGKRSEPSHVLPVAELIAEIKQISVEEVAAQTTKNLEALFPIS